MGPEPFCLRVMEDNDLVESCRFITSINVSETIDLMHGPGKWQFQRLSHVSHLKFYEVPESVDNLQNRKSNFFLDEL